MHRTMSRFLSHEERCEIGHARRKQVGRQQHGPWQPQDPAKSSKRSPLLYSKLHPVTAFPSLVKLKYERMVSSPFGFFRGAVPVMAADLAGLPTTEIVCQLCGDAHVRNPWGVRSA